MIYAQSTIFDATKLILLFLNPSIFVLIVYTSMYWYKIIVLVNPPYQLSTAIHVMVCTGTGSQTNYLYHQKHWAAPRPLLPWGG